MTVVNGNPIGYGTRILQRMGSKYIIGQSVDGDGVFFFILMVGEAS